MLAKAPKTTRIAFVVGEGFGSTERRERASEYIHELDATGLDFKTIIVVDLPSALQFLDAQGDEVRKTLVLMSECVCSRLDDIVAQRPSLNPVVLTDSVPTPGPTRVIPKRWVNPGNIAHIVV